MKTNLNAKVKKTFQKKKKKCVHTNYNSVKMHVCALTERKLLWREVNSLKLIRFS